MFFTFNSSWPVSDGFLKHVFDEAARREGGFRMF
jgi:hypothetical protein